MNLLQRFRYTIEADLHQLFDKKEEKNPITMLNQYIREAEKQTEQTGTLLERQGKLKEKMELELKQNADVLAKREAQLQLALASGEQDLIDFQTFHPVPYDTCTLSFFLSYAKSVRFILRLLISLFCSISIRMHKFRKQKMLS